MAQDMIEKEIRGYCLTLRLGEGAFGDVYLAEHVREKTLAAVKVLRVQLDVDGLKKFINEASATNRLIHPHIVRLLDFGTSTAWSK